MQDWNQLTDYEIIAEIGVRLKAFRISKNLTQQLLADQSGLNRSTIRDLESGKPLNLLSLIQVFRTLDLLSKMDGFLPGPENSPVLASQQVHRKRVKLSKKSL